MSLIINHYMVFLYIINSALVLTLVFLERKSTANTWAWVLVISFIPIVGFFLYIYIGRGISRDRIFDLKNQDRLGMQEVLAAQKESLKAGTLKLPKTQYVDLPQLVYTSTVYAQSLYTYANSVQLFTDGTDKFERLLVDIKEAKHHIHLEYYIYRNDPLGKKIRNALVDAAKRGVEVKVLIDAWGSTGIGKHFFDPLTAVGGQFEAFFPLFLPYINPRINYRNHRKIVVIDGKIGYTGGFNVGDEYLGKDEKFGYWRDNHLRIEGEAVYSLQNRFLMDWNSQHKEKTAYAQAYFPIIYPEGSQHVQIVTSGPDNDLEQIKMIYFKMISLAKKEILIQTPYYIPDESIHTALKAALTAGVKVRIQIPNKPDHMLVYWATYSFVAELLNYGAVIETYGKGFMHAKTMVIDGEVASVGSANIDNRSFKLDFEVNALVYNEALAQEVRTSFLRDSEVSTQLTREIYRQRGLKIKFKESLARLISPLL